MTEDEVWYFAYGSNLNIGQMMNRIGEGIASKRAVLKGYELRLNVHSPRWGGLTANVVRADNSDTKVYGALYRISREKLSVLSTYEGIKPPISPLKPMEKTSERRHTFLRPGEYLARGLKFI